MTSFAAGDSVLFQRANRWDGVGLVVTKNGTNVSYINFGAYGVGAKPIISGVVDATGWTSIGTNLWESATITGGLDTANIVTVNGVSVPMGKWPDGLGSNKCGWRQYTGGSATSLTDNGIFGGAGCILGAIPSVNGGTIVVRKDQFTVQKATISNQAGSVFTYAQYPGQTVPRWTNGNGYFVQNHINTLTVPNEWFWNRTTHKLDMFSVGSPTGIKVSTVRYVVDLTNRQFISFSNINFQGSIYDLITANGANNIRILNCDIDAAGNCALWANSISNLNFQNNTVTNSNNFGIFTANTSNTGNVVSNNFIRNTGVNAGMSSQDGHTIIESCDGILALGGFTAQFNTIKNSGYAHIQFRGSNVLIKNNYLDTSCITKDEGASVYSFVGVGNPTFINQVIDGNIILNSIGAPAGKSSSTLDAKAIYMDINLRNVTIINNSCANSGTFGIILQDNVNNVVRNNTVYNSTNASFGLWNDNLNGGQINQGHIVNKNTFVMRDNRVAPGSNFGGFYVENSQTSSATSWGTSDSNVVACPINDVNAFYTSIQGTFNHRTLAQWQAATGYDLHSLKSFKTISTLNDIQFVYNETNVPKTISLAGTWGDVSGAPTFAGSITLAPFTSRVLLFIGGGAIPLSATATIAANPVPCFGNTTSVTINATGGTAPYQYRIGAGSFGSSNIFSGLAAGTYTFQVRDAALTVFSLNVTVTQPAQISISQISGTITINGGTTTTTVTASGGTGTKNYRLDAGAFQSSNVFTGAAGTHTITVRDANNCTNTLTYTLTQPSVLVVSAAATVNPLLCFGNTTTITVTASGATPPYTYSINGGSFQASNQFTNRGAGTYTLTAKDNAGATQTTTLTITQPSQIIITESHTAIIVNGGVSTVTITASGGTGTKQYSRDGGAFQSSNVFANVPAGNHTVIVRDANNCTNTLAFTITQPSSLSATAISGTILCFGGTTTLTITATGGTTPYQYRLNGGTLQSSNVFTVTAGTYNVTTQDAAGAIFTFVQTVSQPTQIAITESHTAIVINGGTSTVTITASGGTGTKNYSLDLGTFQSSNVFSGVLAGNHSVRVRDANNCINTIAFTITQPNTLSAASASGTILCNGGTTTATITATGGTPPYQYKNGSGSFQSGNTFANLTAGTYTFTVTDAGGAITTTNLTITQPAPIVISLAFGDAPTNVVVSLTGGTPAYQYQLDGGSFQTSATFNNVSSGVHNIVVRDANLCTGQKTFTINNPVGITVSFSPIVCNGGTTAVTIAGNGGVPPYIITGGSPQTKSSGTYTFTVTDSRGAIQDTIVTISQPALMALSESHSAIAVNGGTSTVTASVSGGTGTKNYKLDGGSFQLSNSFANVLAGNHTLTVRDANLCTATINFTITQPGQLIIGVSYSALICFNGTTSVTISGTGGTPPYTVTGGTPQTKAAGTYTFTITDAFGAVADTIVTITQPTQIAISIGTTAILVNGGTSTVTVTASGGTGGLTYSIDGGSYQGSNVFAGVLAGSHTVSVKDANNCTNTNTFTIVQPGALIVGIVVGTAIACNNGTTTVTVSGTGGTTPYTYGKNGTFQSSALFSSITAGTYTFSVKDAFGAQADTIITITQPTAIIVSVSTGTIAVNGGTTTVTVTASGGTGTLQYSLDGGVYQLSNSFAGVSAGSHTMTVKDANNCTTVNSFSISQPGALFITATPTLNPVACYGNTTTVTVSGSGGTSPYTFGKNGVFQGSGTFNTIAAGTYTFSVKDAFSVQHDTILTVGQPGLISLIQVVQYPDPITAYGGNADSVYIQNAGGTPINDSVYEYSLDGGGFTQSDSAFKFKFTNVSGGSHTVTIRDDNGCTATYTFFINQPPSASQQIIRTKRKKHINWQVR